MGQAARIDSGNYLDFVGITVLFLLEESSGGEIAGPLQGVLFPLVPVRLFVPLFQNQNAALALWDAIEVFILFDKSADARFLFYIQNGGAFR